MFSSPFASPKHLQNPYRKTSVEIDVNAATPHGLVSMLFEGLMEAFAQARGAMLSGNVDQKTQAIRRAVRILDEGLKAALNLKDGGRLAADLNDLYAYATLRLTQANLRNDVNAIEECKRLIEPLRDAWSQIGAQVDRSAA
jgi:flagellar protein FliS